MGEDDVVPPEAELLDHLDGEVLAVVQKQGVRLVFEVRPDLSDPVGEEFLLVLASEAAKLLLECLIGRICNKYKIVKFQERFVISKNVEK